MIKTFIDSGVAGFATGLILALLCLSYTFDTKDFPAENMRAAEAICVEINSTLVSADYTEATCANRAEIPYEVKK
jgi:hypothetical protein